MDHFLALRNLHYFWYGILSHPIVTHRVMPDAFSTLLLERFVNRFEGFGGQGNSGGARVVRDLFRL